MEFIESLAFTRKLHQLAGDGADEVLRAIEKDLWANPERGALVQGSGGVRKARIPNPGRDKGKRGGFRYLYIYFRAEQKSDCCFYWTKMNGKI